MQLQYIASWFIIIALTIVALIYGQSLLIPFIFALLIWFVVKKVRNFVDRVQFIKKYIPAWIKTILASLLIFGLLIFIADVLIINIENLSASYLTYAENADMIAQKINETFKIDVNEEVTAFVKEFDFTNYLRSLINSLSEIVGNMVMVVFYAIFLFVEEGLFTHKVKLILHQRDRFENYKLIIEKIDCSMSSYISLKSLINFVTATISYFILLFLGVDSPIFWAFLVFMFNFIPSVGPILGTILPALFSLIQFGEFVPFFVILFGIGTTGTLVGSLLEPRLMGNTLNISPLVAVIALAFWGSLWGIVGMLLSVPITVAMIIIFSQFAATRPLAILLSEKGRV